MVGIDPIDEPPVLGLLGLLSPVSESLNSFPLDPESSESEPEDSDLLLFGSLARVSSSSSESELESELEPEDESSDEDDEEEPSESTDENGIRTTIDYKTNDKGQKIKVTRKVKVYTRTVRRNKNVEARKKWKKFGDCANTPAGPEFGITSESLDEIELVLGVGEKKQEEQPKEASVANAVCRTCGKVGDHWTLRCPLKPTGAGAEAAEAEDTAKKSGGAGKYVPPSLRAGAVASTSTDDGGRGRRDEFATVRVTNLSEDTKEADLQELFRPFGPISRIYLAKDKESNTSRGFAFVSFIRKEDAARAIEKLSGYGYDHLILHLEWAKPSK